MKFTYCPKCGSRHLQFDKVKLFSCAQCDWVFYLNAAAAVGIIIENEEQDAILVLVRNQEPQKGGYDLPGGFVDPGEGAEEAARREVTEELGVEIKSLKYLRSYANRYAFREVDYPTCDLIFQGVLTSGKFVLDREENAEALWVKKGILREELGKFAFPSIRSAVENYLNGDNKK